MNGPLVTSLVATVILAGVFVLPWPRHVLDERSPGFRSLVSFAACLSLAYVFVDLLPEMSGLGDELLEEEALPIPFPEYFVYLAALAGFVLFYGLERLVRWHDPEKKAERRGSEQEKEEENRIDYKIKFAGLGAYTALVLYLMNAAIREGSAEGLVVYVIAMAFHFLAMRHGLRVEFPGIYMSGGRWILAGLCVAGAVLGFLIDLPIHFEALFLGFFGGLLIMNTTVMELPSEKEGRFWAFGLGAALYAALLMAV